MSTPHRGQIYEKPRYPATGPNMPTPPPTQPPFVTTGEDGEGGHNPDQERKNKFQKLRGQVGNSVGTFICELLFWHTKTYPCLLQRMDLDSELVSSLLLSVLMRRTD